MVGCLVYGRRRVANSSSGWRVFSGYVEAKLGADYLGNPHSTVRENEPPFGGGVEIPLQESVDSNEGVCRDTGCWRCLLGCCFQ